MKIPFLIFQQNVFQNENHLVICTVVSVIVSWGYNLIKLVDK